MDNGGVIESGVVQRNGGESGSVGWGCWQRHHRRIAATSWWWRNSFGIDPCHDRSQPAKFNTMIHSIKWERELGERMKE